jgi:multimeric flavodoxin WrbA
MKNGMLKAIALNCTLKSSRDNEKSSTEVLLGQVADALKEHDVEMETIRVVDLNIKPGVQADEGEGDDWPAVRQRILDAQILVVGTPIWLGQPCSLAKRVFERMDAFFSEKDDKGRLPPYGRVGAVVVVGNEDGAHHVSSELYQTLLDVGFSVPPNAVTYWVGEALGSKDYKDLKSTPKGTAGMTQSLAANVAHLARVLEKNPYPGSSS